MLGVVVYMVALFNALLQHNKIQQLFLSQKDKSFAVFIKCMNKIVKEAKMYINLLNQYLDIKYYIT